MLSRRITSTKPVIAAASTKLLETAVEIRRRNQFNGSERKRVLAAFELLAQDLKPVSCRRQRRLPDWRFLQRVHRLLGNAGVALVAAALGSMRVMSFDEADRRALLLDMKMKEAVLFKGTALRRCADLCYEECTSSLVHKAQFSLTVARVSSRQLASKP